jgi:hypothetical protein
MGWLFTFPFTFPFKNPFVSETTYDHAKNGPVVLAANFGGGLRFLLKVKVKVNVKWKTL